MQLLLAVLGLPAALRAPVEAEATHTSALTSRKLAEEGGGLLRLHMYTPFCHGTEATCLWPAGATMNIAVQLMLDHIHAGGYLRGNWTLDVKLFDTACSEEKGRDEVTRLLLLPREERPFAVIGCGCSFCTRAAHPLLNLARVPLISHASTSPSLSNRAEFPNFFRLSTPDHEGLRTLLLMFRALNWTTHAQVYDTFYGEFTVPYVSQVAEGLGMVNVLAGRSIAEIRSASVADAQPIVEALVLARTRGVLYMGYSSLLWSLGCATFKRRVRGMIVAHMGTVWSGWWRLVPDPSCTPAEMDVAVDYWIAAREPMFTDYSAEVECLPPGVTLKAFVDEYERRRKELGVEPYIPAGAAGDTICFVAKIFNALLDMGFTATEVHNMNESTYATYSSVVQGMSMMGTSGPISFSSDPTAFGAGDRINVFWVEQLQDSAYTRVARVDGQKVIFEGSKSRVSFFGGHSLTEAPAALFPTCPLGVYNFSGERCEGCPFGSDFIETEGSCFCSPGFRVNGTECLPCAEGSYSASFGSEACELCDKGTFGHSRGRTSCERCPWGTFMPRLGGAACEPCGLRRTTLERGADTAELCVCEHGSFLHNDTASCEACSEGLQCSVGLSPPEQQPGFWAELREGTHELAVWRCRNILECNGGAVGECAAGRHGRCCNDCLGSHRPADDGTCKPCDTWDLVPAVITAVLVLAVVVVLLVLVREDANKGDSELVGIIIIVTQLCMVLQMLGVFAQIHVRWVDPAKAIMEKLKFQCLDLDLIHGNCWLPSADPVSKFAFQLLAFPFWACTVLVAWCASQCTRMPLASSDVFSLLGAALFMAFITLTLTVLLPFQCKHNPSGRMSMAAHPGLVCFESKEHWKLVVMAGLGFAAYPAACLAWASWATVKYPSWLSSGHGLHLVQKYRFLFGHYKPEHYYFGLHVLYRNGLIALLPIVLVSAEAAQILILCVTLVCSSLLVAHTWPWRTDLANRAGVLMLFCTAVFLVGMAMLVQVTEETQLSFGWLLFVLVVLPLAVGLACVAHGVWRNTRGRLCYEVFLSHHKAGAGVLARFLKLELAKVGVHNTFLDVDSLESLDTLFHIVGRQTRNMVVLLSSETLKRMWCAGEIVTAHRNSVRTVPVPCDGFTHPDELELTTMGDAWTAAELQALHALGISWDVTKAAYAWLRQLPCVELRRCSSAAEHGQIVQDITKLCVHVKAAPLPKPPAVCRPEILVTGAVSDPEALAACQVFRIMLQLAMRMETVVVRTALELQQAQGTASFLVALLTRGVLLDDRFAEIMISASSAQSTQVRSSTWTRRSEASGCPLRIVTVNADAGFEFPSKDFYDGLRRSGLGGSNTERLISTYQSLLRILALPFSPLGSQNLLQNEVSEICRRRFGRLDSSRFSGGSRGSRRTHRSTHRATHRGDEEEGDGGRCSPRGDKREGIREEMKVPAQLHFTPAVVVI